MSALHEAATKLAAELDGKRAAFSYNGKRIGTAIVRARNVGDNAMGSLAQIEFEAEFTLCNFEVLFDAFYAADADTEIAFDDLAFKALTTFCESEGTGKPTHAKFETHGAPFKP